VASKRAKRRRGCIGKHRHETASDAYAHKYHLGKHDTDKMRVYHCRFCGGWHVGHFSNDKERKERI
jgi:hypothetical protein